MVLRSIRLWRTTIHVGLAILAIAGIACRNEGDREDAGKPSRTESVEREWVVPLRAVELRVEPDPASGSVTTAAAGRPLERIEEPGPEAWVRVATWDDRRGWVETGEVVTPAVWSHYERALGGIPPNELRPAYPVEGGWLVEIPYGSPSFYEGGGAYVLADSAMLAGVTRIGAVRRCAGEPRRVAWLDGGRTGSEFRPPVDRARAALPAGGVPGVRGLVVATTSRPGSRIVDAVTRSAEDAGARLERVSWWRVEGGTVWATVEWTSDGPREAAFVALPVEEGSDVDVRTVVAPRPVGEDGTFGRGSRPVFAYETNGVARPTLFVVASDHYDGGRVDLYVARPEDYGRVWTGYSWSCGRVTPGPAGSRRPAQEMEGS